MAALISIDMGNHMTDLQASSWTASADDYFFVLGRDRGVSLERRPDWILKRAPGATVRQYVCSAYPQIRSVLEQNIEHRWTRIKPAIFEINAVPVRARDVVFRGGSAEVGGKCLLNGAAGDRVYTRFLKNNRGMENFRRSNQFFARAREETRLDLPEEGSFPKGMRVAIECRNRRNFYHFMTEALPQLVHFDDRSPSEIVFHCRNNDPSGFAGKFIEAFFPDLAGLVEFTDRRASYDDVLIPFTFRHMIYSNGDPMLTRMLDETGEDTAWQDIGAHVRRRKFAFKNSYDVSMRLLRERVLSMIDPKLIAAMPKKIWVSRDNRSDAVNSRQMYGEDALVARLKREGFEQMHFEHLTPHEQVAAVHAADVIGSFHGAFFGHLMFARSDAHVIEVGSVQTQLHRWGDFLGNAHVAGCRYSKVYADVASKNPEKIRPIADGLVGVRVAPAAIDFITRLATEGQV
ncbi:glycosyltransferase 61 family protein [Paracoccus salsus]|uniref:glycosyltransferase 61 family protein n=1 Tax=Paracoccus salsus TaxID=2911061 RepID=UPI001F2D4BB3|nr:glycosyltransferase family 61 protein [Paracoccus salsus]MCF3973801.1 glycosyltransferase family 61 protein [Paracoccus salsus]